MVFFQSSYYLSFTDCIPVVNIPSGIMHLICGIFSSKHPLDQLATEYKQFTYQKLEDWTHIQKSVAILSNIGIVFLIYSRIKFCFKLLDILKSLNDEKDSISSIPQSLFSDQRWFTETIAYNPRHFSSLFARADIGIRNNESLVLNFINNGAFTYSDYANLSDDLKKNRTIALAILKGKNGYKVYKALPLELKNDREVAKTAFSEGEKALGGNFLHTDEFGVDCLPQQLLANTEWVEDAAAFCPKSFSFLFKSSDEKVRGCKHLIRKLIHAKKFTYLDWYSLPNPLRIDPHIRSLFLRTPQGYKIYRTLSVELRSDSEYARNYFHDGLEQEGIAFLKKGGLSFIPDVRRTDYWWVKDNLLRSSVYFSDIFPFVDATLRGSKQLVLSLCNRDYPASGLSAVHFHDLSIALQNDFEIALTFLKMHGGYKIFASLSPALRTASTIVRTAIANGLTTDPKFKFSCIPWQFRNSRSWLNTSFKLYPLQFRDFFSIATRKLKADKKWALKLISRGECRHYRYLSKALKASHQIAERILQLDDGFYYFCEFPLILRNDPVIASKAFAKASKRKLENSVVKQIKNRSTLQVNEAICKKALKIKLLTFDDLNEQSKSNPKIAITLMRINHRHWADLTPEMQKNPVVLSQINFWINQGSIKFFSVPIPRKTLDTSPFYSTRRSNDVSYTYTDFEKYRRINTTSRSHEWLDAVKKDVQWFSDYWAGRGFVNNSQIISTGLFHCKDFFIPVA